MGVNLKTNLKSNNICLATYQNHQDLPMATTSSLPNKLQSQKEICFRTKNKMKKLTYSLILSFPRRKRKQSQRRRKWVRTSTWRKKRKKNQKLNKNKLKVQRMLMLSKLSHQKVMHGRMVVSPVIIKVRLRKERRRKWNQKRCQKIKGKWKSKRMKNRSKYRRKE